MNNPEDFIAETCPEALLQDVFKALRADLVTLRKDAERYQWLREGRLMRQGLDTGAGQRRIERNQLRAVMTFAYWCTPDDLDMEIDAAMVAAPVLGDA